MRSAVMALLAAVLLLGSIGCATNRGELNIVAPKKAMAAPANGPAVVVRVVDDRKFELKPDTADIPSLKNDADINNPAIKARAIARKRNGYGKAMGDILLPEGQTVAQLVRAVVEDNLRQKGYTVVDDANAAGAAAVDVNITQLWCWIQQSFVAMTIQERIAVAMHGTPVIDGAAQVKAYAKTMPPTGSGANYKRTIELGLDDLSKQVASAVKPAK